MTPKHSNGFCWHLLATDEPDNFHGNAEVEQRNECRIEESLAKYRLGVSFNSRDPFSSRDEHMTGFLIISLNNSLRRLCSTRRCRWIKVTGTKQRRGIDSHCTCQWWVHGASVSHPLSTEDYWSLVTNETTRTSVLSRQEYFICCKHRTSCSFSCSSVTFKSVLNIVCSCHSDQPGKREKFLMFLLAILNSSP